MKSMYASRSVPVLNTPAPNAAYVDDSSSQNESLQRKADMANGAVQRVVQRWPGDDDSSEYDEMHQDGYVKLGDDEYDEMHRNETIPLLEGYVPDFPLYQFVYKEAVNNDLKFEEGRIVFTEYNANLVSSGFTGCMMMAFKFKKPYECKKSPNGTKMVDNRESYIAHVFCSKNKGEDTKHALCVAKQHNYITIEALFKPYQNKDGETIIKKLTKYNREHEIKVALGESSGAMTGRLYRDKNDSWCADVLAQDDHVYEWLGNKKKGGRVIRTLDSKKLNVQTKDYVKQIDQE